MSSSKVVWAETSVIFEVFDIIFYRVFDRTGPTTDGNRERGTSGVGNEVFDEDSSTDSDQSIEIQSKSDNQLAGEPKV